MHLCSASRKHSIAELRLTLRTHVSLSGGVRQAFTMAIMLGFLNAPTAHALLFGEVMVKSRVGEPLLAYIPVSPENPDEKITVACLNLMKAGIIPGKERQDLSVASLELEGNEKMGQQIRISTSSPVNDVSQTIQLKANCISRGLVIREFNFELEPASAPLMLAKESSSASLGNVEVSAPQKSEDKSILQILDLSGSVRAGYFSSSRKLDDKTNLGTGSVWLKATPNLGEDASLFIQGWVRNDDSFREGGSSGRLREGYLNYSAGNADFRIGKQIIAWGRADRLNPTDNLTPRNFTLLTPEEDDQRMGSLAAKMTYRIQSVLLTGIWLPSMDPNVLPIASTPGISYTEHVPHANSFAAKIDKNGGEVDWSASYFSGLDINPDITIGAVPPPTTNLILGHNRIRVLGMDAATAIGRYGLRAEAAYTWTSNAGVNDVLVKKPFFYMVMGGDRTFFDYLNVNVQYYLRQVSNYSDPQNIANPLLRSVAIQGAVLSNQFDRFQHGVSIRVSDKWFNETLEGEIAGIASFGRSNYFIRPKLVYAFSDNMKGSLGLDIYRGESNTFFGQLRNNSLLFTEMKYGF